MPRPVEIVEIVENSTLRIALLFFLTLHFFFLLTSSGRPHNIDESTTIFQAESLAQHGTAAIPQAVSAGLYFGRLDRSGQPQGPFGLAHAVAVLPWYAFGRLLLRVVPGIPPGTADFFGDAVIVASSAAFSALAATLLFLIFCRLGIAPRASLAAAVLAALATPLFSFSAGFYSEPLASALFLAAAWFLFARGELGKLSAQNAALGGICVGISLWVRPVHVLAAVVFLLAVLVSERKNGMRSTLVMALATGIFGFACLLHNQMLYGSPTDFGYPLTLDGSKLLINFKMPILTGLYGLLASPGKSIFLFAPPLFLAIPGVVRLARRNAGLAIVTALLPLVYLLFYARYSQWEGGYSPGPRYLVAPLALLCVGLGPMLAEASPGMRKAALALLIAGFLVQALVISTSYLEDQANGTYYDEHWNYRFSYSPLVSMTQQLLHYIASPTPAPLGRGFDRWFVFLAKAGVSLATVAAGVLLQLAGFLFFGWRLRRALPPPVAN